MAIDINGSVDRTRTMEDDFRAREGARPELAASDARFREMANHAPMMVWMTEPDGRCTFLNDSWQRFTGQTPQEGLGYGWVDAVHPEDRAKAKEAFVTANGRKAPFRVEYRLRRNDGEYRWALDAAHPRLGPAGEFLGYIGSVIEITERKRAERLEAGQREALELMASDAPLERVFEALIRMVEEQSPTKVLASILIADPDGKRLRHGCAPSLPDAYNEAIDGVAIGPEVGSCGTAAYHKHPVYVADIANSHLWKNFAQLAGGHSLRACWSTPILSSSGELLGTFAMYYQAVREPLEEDLHIVGVATRTAAIAIERKRTETRLAKLQQETDRQRRLYETILSSIPDLVYVFDLEHRFTYANEALLKMWGRTAEYALGKTCLELGYEPWHAEMHDLEIDTVVATKKPIRGEVPFVGTTGRRFYDYIFVPVFGATGEVVAVAGSTRDITERKEAEEALRLAQTRLDATLTAAEVATWSWDIVSNRMCGDKNAARIFSLSEDEAANGPVEAYARKVHPDDWPAVEAAVARALKEGVYEMEYRVLRPDGSTINVVARGKVDYDNDGTPIRFPGIVIDITARKRAEEALRLSEQRFHLAARATSDAIWDWDLQSNTIWWNEGVQILFRYEASSVLPPAQWWYDHIHPEDRDRVVHGIHEVIDGTETFWRDEYRFLRSDGTYADVLDRGYVVRDATGKGVRMIGAMQDLSDRKKALQDLQEQFELTRTITENSTQGIFMMDATGTCTYMNRAAEKMLGFTRQEISKGKLHDFIHHHHPDGRPYPMNECPIDRALPENFNIREHEDVFIRKNGEFFPVRVSASPIFKDGRPVFTVVEVRDVSESKRAEDALRLSRERLNLVIEASRVGVWFCDLPLQNLDWDARVKEHFWIQPDQQVTIELFFERLHPEDRNKTRLAIDAAIQRGSPYDVEYRTVSPAGEQRWVRAIGRAFYDDTGRANRFDGVTIDVTADKKREADLREAADRLRFMAEAMPQKIFTADASGNVNYVNRQWTTFVGFAVEELLGSNWTQVLHADDAQETISRWKHAVETGETFQMEHRYRRADGEYRWHLTRAHAMRDGTGKISMWIGSNTDIDDQKRAEANLEQIVSERTARLKATIAELEAFSYSVSHDLRSPLRAMQGYSEELIKRLGEQLAPDNRQYLERIRRAAARLDRLTQEVLAYSRLSRAEISLQNVDLDRLVEDIVEQYPNLQSKADAIQIDKPLGTCVGHEAFLTQSISNLLTNAIKFARNEEPLKIRIRSERFGSNIRLWVEDNGIGIESRHSKRMFQMFGKIHPDSKYEGTGIGLAVVKKSVERMNGTVGFESVPKQGSRFWIELPCSAD